MAFISGASQNRLGLKHAPPSQRRGIDAQQLLTWDSEEDARRAELAKIGMHLQGEFDGKIRTMALFDSHTTLDKLRVWTSEQDGYIQIRKAATGMRVNTIEKKDGAFVTSLAYSQLKPEHSHDNLLHEYVYVGYSDGFLRVHEKKTHTNLNIYGAKAGKTGLKFEDGNATIKAVVPNSPADLAGFQDGQTVVSVNGVVVSSGRDVCELIDKARGTAEVGVSLMRKVENEPESEEPEYEVVQNIKKHNKEVLCMQYLEEVRIRHQETYNVLFTGGRDWLLLLWKWDVKRRPPPGPNVKGDELWTREQFDEMRNQTTDDLRTECYWHEGLPGTANFKSFDGFTGSQNAVQCMAFLATNRMSPDGTLVSKDCMYLGGDDFTIKCLDLRTGYNVMESPHPTTGARGFPITASSDPKHGHREGITCLAVNEKYLFSASKDGTVRVWNSEFGYPVHLGGRSSNALYRSPHGDAQLKLLMVNNDPIKEHGHLWSAGVDGVIRVWQAWGDPHAMYSVQPPEGMESVVQWSTPAMDDPAKGQDPLQRDDIVYVADVGRGKATRLKDGYYVDKQYLEERDVPDEDGCFGAWLVANLMEHRGAMIRNLGVVQKNVHGSMYWSAHKESDRVQLYYTKSDQADQDGETNKGGFSEGEQGLITTIEELRHQVLENAVEMEDRKRRKNLIERRDNTRKAKLQNSFAKTWNVQQQRRYYFRLLKFANVQSCLNRRKELTELMLRNQMAGGLRQLYYSKFKHFTRLSRARKRRQKFAGAVLASGDKTLQILYWHHLQVYMKRHRAARKRRDVTQAMLANTSRGLMLIYFSRLKAFNFRGKQRKKKSAIAHALMAKSDKGLKIVYYNKMVAAAKRMLAVKSKENLADTLAGLTVDGLRKTSYGKWIRWSKMHKQGARRKQFAAALGRGSEQFLVRLYNKKALDWAAILRRNRMNAALGELDDQAQRLEELLKASNAMSDEELDREIEKYTRRIEELEKEIADLKVKINEQRDINAGLETNLTVPSDPPEGTTIEERMNWLVRRLKAHGVLCGPDSKEITYCRKDFAKEWREKWKGESRASREALAHSRSPSKMIESAINSIRSSLAESWDLLAAERGWRVGRPGAGTHWGITAEVIAKMNRDLTDRCQLGIVQLVYGWDWVHSREKEVIYGQKISPEGLDSAPAGTVEHTTHALFKSISEESRKEIDFNCPWILFIATRMWGIRHSDHPSSFFAGCPPGEGSLNRSRRGADSPRGDAGERSQSRSRREGSGHQSAPGRSGDHSRPATKPAAPVRARPVRGSQGPGASTGGRVGSSNVRSASGAADRSGASGAKAPSSGARRAPGAPAPKSSSSAARRAPA